MLICVIHDALSSNQLVFWTITNKWVVIEKYTSLKVCFNGHYLHRFWKSWKAEKDSQVKTTVWKSAQTELLQVTIDTDELKAVTPKSGN